MAAASACAAVALKRAAAIAVCAVLVLSSLWQPAMATYCSDCPSTCHGQVSSNCGAIPNSVMSQCMRACSGTYSQCNSSCSSAADYYYNSCKSTVYQRCMNTCNSNCTATNP